MNSLRNEKITEGLTPSMAGDTTPTITKGAEGFFTQSGASPPDQFKEAMRAAGLAPPDVIEADGTIQRFPTNGEPDDTAGWYVYHADGIPAGSFGDWRSGGLTQHWRMDLGHELTPAEEALYKAQEDERRRKREAEEEQLRDQARKWATNIWSTLVEANIHPYLTKKRIKAHGARSLGQALIVPLRVGTEIHSFQYIWPAGNKTFLEGGRVRGGYFCIGEPDKVLCIAEGFATGASIHEATGYPVAVAFNAGNLLAVAKAMRAKFPDIQLVLCADDDFLTDGNPGLTKATEAAHAVGGCLAIPDFGEDRPEGATDFNDLARHLGPGAVKDAIGKAKGVDLSDGWPERMALQRELSAAPRFPINALGDLLAPAVYKMREVIQAPSSICGSSVLAAAAMAVQGHADVVIDGRVSPTSCLFMTVAESGERKTVVDTTALRPHRQHEKELHLVYEQAKKDYDIDIVLYEKNKARLLRGTNDKAEEAIAGPVDKSPAGRRKALADLGPPPQAPLSPVILCEEPTYEGLVKLLADGQPSIGIFSDEGGRFVGGYGMNQDNFLKTAAGISGLWDGKTVDRVRAGDGSVKLYGRRVSSHLMMQPVVATKLLSNPMLLEQGLLSRCLVTFPNSNMGQRTYVSGNIAEFPEIRRYAGRLADILCREKPLESGKRNELAPRQIELSADAKRRWLEFQAETETQLPEGGTYEAIRGFANKAPEHAVRLAGVLALVENIHCELINTMHIENGITLMRFYLDEAVRLLGSLTMSPEITLAQKLLDWLHARKAPTIKLQEVYQLGPRGVRTSGTAKAMMQILSDHGHVRQKRGTWEVRNAVSS